MFIFSRRFFLHDCDSFTRKYYSDMLGITQPEGIPLPMKESRPLPEYVPPPHIMVGSPEDTYASCLSFVLKPPRKDVVRQLLNFPKKLRYLMQMDAVHPEDNGRDFILEYNLSDGTILVSELEKRNSGRMEGSFLKATLVPKPNTGRDNPQYYTPQDFFIGAKINIFNHYFVITSADLFVYRYVEANPEKFAREVRDNIRNYFAKENLLGADIGVAASKLVDAEEAESRAVMPAEASIGHDSEAECLRDYQAQARRQYEGEHGELRPRSPPPEELCPDIAVRNNPENSKPSSLKIRPVRHDSRTKAQQPKKDMKKEVTWEDQAVVIPHP